MDGREAFKQKVDEIIDTFMAKNAGYAGEGNPDAWANFRHAEGFGVPASTGVLVRISDKFARLQSLTRNPANDKVGESRIDSAIDMAVYAIIYACILEEEDLKANEKKLELVEVDRHPTTPYTLGIPDGDEPPLFDTSATVRRGDV